MKISLRVIFLLSLACPGSLLADAIDDAVKLVEDLQMLRLAEEQKRPDVRIHPFRSDGCSGGMSETWRLLAEHSPQFARSVGKKPPWENCCVAHDRHYWQGDTQNGYEKRKQADAELRACVRESGTTHSGELARQLGIARQDVELLIQDTAELMYQAVRLGGAPCTTLPWRWGHGWPACSIELPAVIE